MTNAEIYQKLLISMGRSPDEKDPRRKHPRFRNKLGEKLELSIDGTEALLRDFSAGGVSLYSPLNFPIGRLVHLKFGDGFEKKAIVWRVDLNDKSVDSRQWQFMHVCRFKFDEDGYEVVIYLLKRMLEHQVIGLQYKAPSI